MKSRWFYVIRLFIPFLILIGAFGMDRLEIFFGRKYGSELPETYWWLRVLIRFVFALMVFAGITIFLSIKEKSLFINILWLVLGFFAMFISTPTGNLMRSYLVGNPFLASFPTRLFFMAGCFVLIGGVMNLILLRSEKRKLEVIPPI